MIDDWDWNFNRDGKQKKQVDLFNPAGGMNVTDWMENYEPNEVMERSKRFGSYDMVRKDAHEDLVTCEGRWEQRDPREPHRFLLFGCFCHWLCVPCDGTEPIWNRNPLSLPSTMGALANVSGRGLKRGDKCLCGKRRPGPQTGCLESTPKKAKARTRTT